MIRNLALASLLAASFFPAFAQTPSKADPAKGKVHAEAICVACHGVDGNSPASAFPHIAGQSQDYLQTQITTFKTGLRTDPSMDAMVAAVPDEDVAHVAAWYALQKLNTPAAPAEETAADLLARGKQLWRAGDAAKGVPACAACHGVSGHGLPAQYPRLAGQFPEYTKKQLESFRLDIAPPPDSDAPKPRTNDPEAMMRTIAGKLSDKDIQSVSQYAAGLR
jgi:cytochrome c553